MHESITWVGIDAHKRNLQFAVLAGGQLREWEIANESKAIRRAARKLLKQASGELHCCYEAGPIGYALERELEAAAPELICEVIAPPLIPVKSGERVKTDRRDARKLAQYLKAGLLTEVHPPSEQDESARDLTRCRRALKGELMHAHHHQSKWLLRRGVHYTAGKKQWTGTHHKWLHSLSFERGPDQVVFDQYLLAIDQLLERLEHLDAELKLLSESEVYREPIG